MTTPPDRTELTRIVRNLIRARIALDEAHGAWNSACFEAGLNDAAEAEYVIPHGEVVYAVKIKPRSTAGGHADVTVRKVEALP